MEARRECGECASREVARRTARDARRPLRSTPPRPTSRESLAASCVERRCGSPYGPLLRVAEARKGPSTHRVSDGAGRSTFLQGYGGLLLESNPEFTPVPARFPRCRACAHAAYGASSALKQRPARQIGKYKLVLDPSTSVRLGLVRQQGTTPELAARAALRALGLRYSTSNRDLFGSPDLANRTRRWAVFVHGCFWHGHRRCRYATIPKRNRQFWLDKFEENRGRDSRATRALRRAGFTVVVLWECHLRRWSQDLVTRRLGRLLLRTQELPIREPTRTADGAQYPVMRAGRKERMR